MQIIQDGIRYNRIADGEVAVVGFGIQISRSQINIPEYTKNGYKVVMIQTNAFSENEDLESVCLPATINHIGKNAFYKCKKLTTVNILPPEDLTETETIISIYEKAFYKCKNLSQFITQKNIKLCGDFIFKDCVLLPKINCEIYGNLTNGCFANCVSLSEFYFYDSNMQVDLSAFDGCVSLKNFYIEKDVDLSEEFFNTFKESKFYCHENSKYLNLAYRGYHVRKILPKV